MSAHSLQIDLAGGIGVEIHRSTLSAPHRQWGVAIIIGLESEVEIVEDSARTRGRAVVVPADLLHVTRSAGPTVTMMLDADGHRRAMLEARRPRSFSIDVPGLTARAGDILGAAPADRIAMGLALARRLLPAGSDPTMDPRIVQTTAKLSAVGSTPLPVLASAVGLSPGHLSTLFHRQVGLPLQRWKLWRRLHEALAELRANELTEAAMEAGFSDHAHLTRTCTRLLGYTPSRFARALEAGGDR